MNRESAQDKPFWATLFVFAIALLARLPFLDRAALWGDETLFVKFLADASLSPWQVFLDYWDACTDLGQLPLAGVLLNVYIHLAGRFVPDVAASVFALRLPGVFAGALAVVGIHALGRRWASRPVAWAATAWPRCSAGVRTPAPRAPRPPCSFSRRSC